MLVGIVMDSEIHPQNLEDTCLVPYTFLLSDDPCFSRSEQHRSEDPILDPKG